jgi:hypothetical protein
MVKMRLGHKKREGEKERERGRGRKREREIMPDNVQISAQKGMCGTGFTKSVL